MNNHKHRFPGVVLWFVVLSVMGFAPFSMAQAVSIDTLSVSSVAFNIQVTNDGTYNFSGPVSPPVYLTMGTYQDPIVSGTNWKIYSTGLFGKPVPTGSVDSVMGTISVDFSSLRGQFMSTYGMLDIALPLVTNPPAGGTYNGTTGVYSLNWSDPFTVTTTVLVGGVPRLLLSTVLPPLRSAAWSRRSRCQPLSGCWVQGCWVSWRRSDVKDLSEGSFDARCSVFRVWAVTDNKPVSTLYR